MDSIVVEESQETPEDAAQYANVEEAPPEMEQPQEAQALEMPSKFQGKSMNEVLSSYENLEKELGRKGQELGELRKLTDNILQQQVTAQDNGTIEASTEELDFFDDPDKAVNKAIENHPKFRQFEEQQKAQAAEVTTQRLKQAHPDYLEVISDSKFQEWVQGSNIRQNLFVAAHNYNLDAAMELMNNWKERALINNTSEAETAKANQREQAMKVGKGVSRTNAESTSGKKIYRRADLIRLKTNDPDRYESLQDEILAAYAEGRVK